MTNPAVMLAVRSTLRALFAAMALAIAPAFGLFLWGVYLGLVENRAGFDSITLSFMGLVARFVYPVVVVFGVPIYLALRVFGLLSLPICIVFGALLASPFIIFLSDGSLVVIACGALSGAFFWTIAPGNSRRSSGSVEAFVLIIVSYAGLLGGIGLASSYRQIPAEITAVGVESRFGWILEYFEERTRQNDLYGLVQFQERLRSEPAILTVKLDGPNDQTFYRRDGVHFSAYGCSGDRNPAHEGLMQCTLHTGIFGRRAISYTRTVSDHGNQAVRIMFDRDKLLQRMFQDAHASSGDT